MRRLVVVLLPTIAFAVGARAEAQPIDGAPGAVKGLFGGQSVRDPNRTSQELTLRLNLGGGYDDNVDTLGEMLGGAVVPERGGYAATASATGLYWRGTERRFFEGSGNVFANRQSISADKVVGGDAYLQGASNLGRRMGMTAGMEASYQPATLLGSFRGTVGEASGSAVADVSPPVGILQEQWLALRATGGFFRDWTRRQRTAVLYTNGTRQSSGESAATSYSQAGAATHRWTVGRDTSIEGRYRYDRSRLRRAAIEQTLDAQTVDFGMTMLRRLSPSRSFGFSFKGGLVRAVSTPIAGAPSVAFVLPVVSGTVQASLTGKWIVAADFERSVSGVDSLISEPFATNAATLRVEGTLARRIRVQALGTYSRGDSRVSDTGAYDATRGMAQMQYALSSMASIFGSYSYYDHRLDAVTAGNPGFPSVYERNAVRVGFTMWLPLYGRF